MKFKFGELLRKVNFLSILSLILFLASWELIVDFGIISRWHLESPIVVVRSAFMKLYSWGPEGGTLIDHAISSLTIALGGFFLAASIGVPLGLLMGWYKKIDAIVSPIFEVGRQIPPIAWIPLAILWFGIGVPAKSFIIWLAAFVPCIINSYTGIKLTDPTLIDLAKTFGATDRQIFFNIAIPSSLPAVFTGLKLAVIASWMTLVAAELLAATAGLGYMIEMSRRLCRPDLIIVGMATIGLIGAVLTSFLDNLEKRLCPWR
jgi:NitT/TauT family transport system permease protein